MSRDKFQQQFVNLYVDTCASVKVEKKWQEKLQGDMLCEALLVSAYHRININFSFSVATPSALYVLMCVYRYSEPQAYVRISVVVYCAIHLMSHNAGFVSGAPSFMLFHVSW